MLLELLKQTDLPVTLSKECKQLVLLITKMSYCNGLPLQYMINITVYHYHYSI